MRLNHIEIMGKELAKRVSAKGTSLNQIVRDVQTATGIHFDVKEVKILAGLLGYNVEPSTSEQARMHQRKLYTINSRGLTYEQHSVRLPRVRGKGVYVAPEVLQQWLEGKLNYDEVKPTEELWKAFRTEFFCPDITNTMLSRTLGKLPGFRLLTTTIDRRSKRCVLRFAEGLALVS